MGDTSVVDFPRPKNFPYKSVFYFDGEIALIKGKYKNSKDYDIGMRWMVAESNQGYPITYGKPVWMVIPTNLASFILEGIFKDLENLYKNILDFEEFMDALRIIRVKNEKQ